MGLNREEKAAVVDEVSAQIAQAQSIVVAEYRGLEVGQITGLRSQARGSGVYLRVLKNTLARRAVAGTPFEKLTDRLVGPLIYGISTDAVSAAKVINDFAKTNDKLVVKAGALPNSLLDVEGVKALANLPSRDEMINVSGGWHSHLDVLGERLRGQTPRPFWPRIEPLEREYEARIAR